MIKKIVGFIIFYIFLFSLSQVFLLASYLTGNKEESANIVKNIGYYLLNYLYENAFNSGVYYSVNQEYYGKTNNIDIIIINHINALDLNIYISIIRQFDDRPIYFIMKKAITMVPGVGFIVGSCNDIKLSRKLDDDVSNLITSINKIKSGVIVIYPEGTRYTKDKCNESVKHCKTNNLHIFNNVLYPKMKGIWIICNELIKQNKMGNIIDFTIMVDKLRGQDGFLSTLLKKEMGNSYGIISTYKVPQDNSITSYDDFKKWFIPIWINKDNILQNIGTVNDKNIYKKVKMELKPAEYILLILVTSLFIYIMMLTKGLYLPISLVISYIIMICMGKKYI